MSIDVIRIIGLWEKYHPIRTIHTLIRAARNRRRARRGLPLLPPLKESDMQLFPNGTMTKTGAGGSILTPIVLTVLHYIGIGECTPDAVAAMPNCISDTDIGAAIITIIFGAIAWAGKVRADKRHQAELAAVAQAAAAGAKTGG